jgi:hypothetical protein
LDRRTGWRRCDKKYGGEDGTMRGNQRAGKKHRTVPTGGKNSFYLVREPTNEESKGKTCEGAFERSRLLLGGPALSNPSSR